MTTSRMRKLILSLSLGLAILLVFTFLVSLVPMPDPAMAAPPAAPTPVSVSAADGSPEILTFADEVVMTADGVVGSELPVYAVQRLDLQHIVDQTVANGTTVTLQYSNDGSNWVTGPTVATVVSSDLNDMQQYATFGRYNRFYADVSNSNPITITLIAVGK